jgi:hypothetical protein
MDPLHLAGTVAVGAPYRLAARPATHTVAYRAVLGAGDIQFFLAAKNRFLKSDGDTIVEVWAPLGRLAGAGGGVTEEGVKDITKAAEIKPLKTTAKDSLSSVMAEAVIGGPFVRVREHLISLVYFFELTLGAVPVIVVRVVFKSQTPESLLYLLVGGISADAEDFIVIAFR